MGHLATRQQVSILLSILLLAVLCSITLPDKASGAIPTPIGGVVSNGPISQARVSIYQINLDQSQGTLAAGPFTTDTTGRWNGSIANKIASK
ncbi:MAG: hypothetical protein HZB31_09485 [Nitrospirae bacterium]|nr:hypothetical protein [Nitrospirota bacterium]